MHAEMNAPGQPPVDMMRAMERVGGDESLLAELMAMFVDEYPREMQQVRNAISAGNAKEMADVAHLLRGALGMIAAESAMDLARTPEVLLEAVKTAIGGP